MVSVRRDKDLGFVPEPTERDRMDQAITVALKKITRTPRPVVLLRMKSAARCCGTRREPEW
jgi:hypothetical protein